MNNDKLDVFDNTWKRLSDLEQTILDLGEGITNQEVEDLLEKIDSYSDDIDNFQETFKDLDMSEQLSEVLMRCENYLLRLEKPIKKIVDSKKTDTKKVVSKKSATKKPLPKKMSVKKPL